MKNNSIDKKEIERLLPHREPMLLIDRLINIIPLKSATAIVNVKKTTDSDFLMVLLHLGCCVLLLLGLYWYVEYFYRERV